MKNAFFSLCLLLALGFDSLRAAIVLDDAQQEPAPSLKRGIDVPKPKDTTPAPGEKTAPATDLLRFANKDILHGFLVAYEQAKGLRWQSPDSETPIAFKAANVAEIKLDSRKPPESAAQPSHAVTLTNDDELPGSIVSLDEKTLLLETWYAGKLSIPRAMVRLIRPLKMSSRTVFEGPTSIEGWVSGRQGGGKSWIYRDGALIGSNYGTIGRDVKLPNIASIDFDVIWRGNAQVSVCLYSDRLDNISNCYMLQMNNSYVYLQRYSRDGGSNSLGEPAQLRDAMRRDKTHIGVRVNKETKTIWLLVDGTMVKQWTDPGEFAGAGTSLLFSCQSGTSVKVSNIKISQWDGKFETARGAAAKTREDSVKLENQDKVSGKLKSIEKGNAQFASSYADLTIPLERVEEISLSSEGADQAKRSAGDVRAFFPNRGSVTLQLESWDSKQAVASSPNFGKATFSPDAFQRIQFNLDQQQPADDLPGDAGGDETR